MPNSAVLSFSDPYEYQNAVRATNADAIITSPGQFEAELTRIDLRRLWMQRGRETLPRIAKIANAIHRQPIMFLMQGSRLVFGRQELLPGEIMFYVPGSEHYQRSSGPIRWATMSLSLDDFADAVRTVAGRDLPASTSDRVVRPPPHLMTRLSRLHETAGHLAANAPEILAHPEVARALEYELVRSMVSCLVADRSHVIETDPRHRIPVMPRLERLLEANPDHALYLPEVCAAIGVAERTLRLHCMEQLGMSPHRYLWLRRMNLARRMLAHSDASTTSVTRIANDFGFAELGRFAVAYHKLFGEPPSATLRRPLDHPRTVPADASFGLLPKLP